MGKVFPLSFSFHTPTHICTQSKIERKLLLHWVKKNQVVQDLISWNELGYFIYRKKHFSSVSLQISLLIKSIRQLRFLSSLQMQLISYGKNFHETISQLHQMRHHKFQTRHAMARWKKVSNYWKLLTHLSSLDFRILGNGQEFENILLMREYSTYLPST